jgi:hypothetical protein
MGHGEMKIAKFALYEKDKPVDKPIFMYFKIIRNEKGHKK